MSALFEGLEEPRPQVTYLPKVAAAAPFSLDALLRELPLGQRTAHMYGKAIPVPRLECWFGQRPYAFGGRVEHPVPWTPLARALCGGVTRLAVKAGAMGGQPPFDSCFANLYRDGRDHIPWHSDEAAWIGPVIASVTFGAARRFVLRHKATKTKHEWLLGDGDVLVMHAGVQREWEHEVPATTAQVGPRLNLTFRQTVGVGR